MPLRYMLRYPRRFLLLYLTLAGCTCSKSPKDAPEPAVSAAASAVAAPSAAAPAGLTTSSKRVLDVVNSAGFPAYSGPTGTVRGRVVISGDAAPSLEGLAAQIPGKCLRAREMYAKIFREGMRRAAADVFVSVTGYTGYVPPRSERVLVEARDCTWQTRTIGVMFGQRIDVKSVDMETYAPRLVGARMPAQMFAIPRSDAVELYPPQPGRYLLADSSHPFTTAEVLVVKYPTFDVTGLDGRFEITGVPTGKLTLGAILPAIVRAIEQPVEVEADAVTEVELEIPFDASQLQPVDAGKPQR
jgi:hypothetical protein